MGSNFSGVLLRRPINKTLENFHENIRAGVELKQSPSVEQKTDFLTVISFTTCSPKLSEKFFGTHMVKFPVYRFWKSSVNEYHQNLVTSVQLISREVLDKKKN